MELQFIESYRFYIDKVELIGHLGGVALNNYPRNLHGVRGFRLA